MGGGGGLADGGGRGGGWLMGEGGGVADAGGRGGGWLMGEGGGEGRQVQRCFTPAETIRTVRDGEPRASTSTFTQLLSSENTPCSVQCCLSPQRP